MGRNGPTNEVKKTVANITREQVTLFLSYCVIREEKKAVKKSRRIERPIISNGYGERGQVGRIGQPLTLINNYHKVGAKPWTGLPVVCASL